MKCSHTGYRTIRSQYDHDRCLLTYYWACERCGARLHDARRDEYRPSFNPRGNDPYLAAAS